jgi:hypothetical protein
MCVTGFATLQMISAAGVPKRPGMPNPHTLIMGYFVVPRGITIIIASAKISKLLAYSGVYILVENNALITLGSSHNALCKS